MSKKKKKTLTVTQVRENLQEIGDKAKDLYDDTGDLKAAQTAISAYGAAINAAKTQVIYKKLVGKPARISFLEK